MKKSYKYIYFIKIDQLPKTSVWSCCNKKSGDKLGIVKWHGPWRQYCYFPTNQAVYNDECLKHIAGFIEFLTAKKEM